MRLEYKRSKGGFPIRKSLDHSSFAAPQGLSQRTTSFIASQRQGIHRMLLRHLIALMIDARRVPQQARTERPASGPFEPEALCLPNTSQSALSRKPRMCSLFTMSNIRASPIGKARIPFIPDAPRWPMNRRSGGARRDRTDDLKLAKLALSQLSYGPMRNRQTKLGGPGTTRTSDLTLIRGAL
jgi:hypothetical protein